MNEIELSDIERKFVNVALRGGPKYWLIERAAGRTTPTMRNRASPEAMFFYDMTPERASFLLALIMVQTP